VSAAPSAAARRVCHITTTHPFDDHRIFHKECVSLAEAGYDVTLIAPHDRGETRGGVRIVPLRGIPGHPLRRMARRSVTAYRLARALDADLYHFHDPDFLPFAAALARRGKAVVYDAHEDVPAQILTKHWIRPSLRAPISRSVGRVEAAAVRRLSAVICADPLNVSRFSALSDHVVLVANYPRLDDIRPAPWEGRERAVCYVGGISDVRGSVELVDAMAHVDARLLLAGPVSPASLLTRLERSPGWPRTEFHGRLPSSGVTEILGRAQVGALPLHAIPNYVVAQPVKLFEYMAAGIPVVASDVSPWSDIIRRHACGLCVPAEDARALAAAFGELLDDPRTARAMGERGRTAAVEHYDWSVQAATLLELYGSLLA
jgi:glycosyltransferase involved in cell wall biosynthesis